MWETPMFSVSVINCGNAFTMKVCVTYDFLTVQLVLFVFCFSISTPSVLGGNFTSAAAAVL